MHSNELAKINMLESYFQRLPRFIQNHSQAVAYYTEMLMKQLVILQEEMAYLPPALLPKADLLGRYHDIGKVGISNEIWEAAAPLKPMEKKLVQMHPIIGAYIVQEEIKLIPFLRRHAVGDLRFHIRVSAGDNGVPQPVAAFVRFQRLHHRLPGGRPILALFLIPDIEISPWAVDGLIVEFIAGHPAVGWITVKAETTAGIGDDAAKTTIAKIIDPGSGGIRPRYHIFSALVVKIAVPHNNRKPP